MIEGKVVVKCNVKRHKQTKNGIKARCNTSSNNEKQMRRLTSLVYK